MAAVSRFVPDNPLYSETCIAEFFAGSLLSADEVHNLILDLLVKDFPSSEGIPKIHVDAEQGNFQGSASYVVLVSSGENQLVAQYRKHNHRLDSQVMETAYECYGDWVPRAKIYDSKDWQISFSPYAGLSYALQQNSYTYDERANAVRDYATFAAQSCFKAREPDPCEVQDIRQKLATWATWKLIDDVSHIMKEAYINSSRPLEDFAETVGCLFSLPMVFTHGDVGNGTNILSDASGHITGVIDWSESTWKPFGFGLLGLEIFLGCMGDQGYILVERHEDLCDLFWEAMWENMPSSIKEKRQELEKPVKLAKTVGTLFCFLSYYSNEGQVSDFDLEFMRGRLAHLF